MTIITGFGLILLGAFAGGMSGLLGIGGGIVIVPALTQLFHMPIQMAAATSLAIIIPTAISGTITHLHNDNVDLGIAALVAIGAVMGAILGATLSEVIPALWLRRIFGALLALTAVRLLVGK